MCSVPCQTRRSVRMSYSNAPPPPFPLPWPDPQRAAPSKRSSRRSGGGAEPGGGCTEVISRPVVFSSTRATHAQTDRGFSHSQKRCSTVSVAVPHEFRGQDAPSACHLSRSVPVTRARAAIFHCRPRAMESRLRAFGEEIRRKVAARCMGRPTMRTQ